VTNTFMLSQFLLIPDCGVGRWAFELSLFIYLFYSV